MFFFLKSLHFHLAMRHVCLSFFVNMLQVREFITRCLLLSVYSAVCRQFPTHKIGKKATQQLPYIFSLCMLRCHMKSLIIRQGGVPLHCIYQGVKVYSLYVNCNSHLFIMSPDLLYCLVQLYHKMGSL